MKNPNNTKPENARTTFFLLGLVLVFAILFVALEYNGNGGSKGVDEEQNDDMSEDLELLPAPDMKDMIVAAPEQKKQTESSKLKAVDKEMSKMEKLNTINNLRQVGDAIDPTKNDNNTSALSPLPTDKNNNPLSLRVVEQLPEFPGGMVEFMKWLTKTLQYPRAAQQRRLQGKVVVSFIVNKDGTIANPKVEKSVDPLLDREAMRVVRMMPKWKPGEEKGIPCRTMIAIPIVFKNNN